MVQTWSTYFRLPYCSLSLKYWPSSTFYIDLSDLLYTYFWLTTLLSGRTFSFWLDCIRSHNCETLGRFFASSTPMLILRADFADGYAQANLWNQRWGKCFSNYDPNCRLCTVASSPQNRWGLIVYKSYTSRLAQNKFVALLF